MRYLGCAHLSAETVTGMMTACILLTSHGVVVHSNIDSSVALASSLAGGFDAASLQTVIFLHDV